jgi:hypothetical protein
MMYEIERAIPTSQVEIVVQCRARRQVFRDGSPLTTGGENIHEAVHNLAHDHCAFVAAALAWRDQCPPNQAAPLESQMILRIQLLMA